MKSTHTARQFSLQSLLAAMVFAALGLFAWRSHGYLGVALLGAFVAIVAANIAIAATGAKLGRAYVSGAFGGAALWSILAIAVGLLDGGVFRLEQSMMFAVWGVVAGLVCGVFARLKWRRVDGDRRRGGAYCGILLAGFVAVLGVGRLVEHQKLLQPGFNEMIWYHGDEEVPHVVEFFGNGIGDGSIEWMFPDVPGNEKVVVRFRCTRVTDTGLQELAKFSNVTHADLRGTLATEAGVARLRAELPNCIIRY